MVRDVNKKYGKLVDGKLVHPLRVQLIGGKQVFNPTANKYLSIGYKAYKPVDKPVIEGKEFKRVYIETETTITEVWEELLPEVLEEDILIKESENGNK